MRSHKNRFQNPYSCCNTILLEWNIEKVFSRRSSSVTFSPHRLMIETILYSSEVYSSTVLKSCILRCFQSYVALFFFQAEDGIRDFHVTGVQTCALPIYRQGAGHVLDHCIDGCLLVRGLLEGEGLGKGLVVLIRIVEAVALAGSAAGIDI